jgi:hypothetical protein
MSEPLYALRLIRLELARSAEYPRGSSACGYEFVAPLDNSGHIDADAWKASRDRCYVHRFWRGEDDKTGMLVHRPGGTEGATWVFDYDDDRLDDDEAGFRFSAHAFAPGEYVSIRDEDHSHTFRVVAVEAA